MRKFTNNSYTFGSYVRELRIKNNIGQRELAKKIGIAASYLNDIEKNKRSAPKNNIIKKLSLILLADLDLLNDLAGHETIGYIKTLEDERDHYKNELSTSIQRQRALRSSFNAQGRQLNKIRSSGGRARSRPLSATRGFSRGSAHGGFMRPSSASTNRSHR